MNKILFFSFLLVSMLTVKPVGTECQESPSFLTTFSAGYVFKNDCLFKQVYGHGMINILTADSCYYPWECWGLGVKASYWRAKGRTTFLQQCTWLRSVPVTFYVRRVKEFESGLQAYLSLGGGIVWVKEKSYLATQRATKGIGEVEVGLNYPVCGSFSLMTAFRYLFPPQSQNGEKMDFGGCDLRAGIGFSY